MSKIRLATVFSGIGSIEFALKRLSIPHEVIFACDTGEVEIEYDKAQEIEKVKSLNGPKEKMDYVNELYASKTRKHNFVRETYLANYHIRNNLFFQDINLLDGRDFENQVDLFVGGSPCQSFSSVGFQGGLEDARGTLFYEFGRLVKEIKPKVFIYENVRNMLKHDKGRTWEIIKASFDELGYELDHNILNAMDFNIPQKRSRLFVVGYRKDLGIKPKLPTKLFESYVKPQYVMQDFLITHTAFGNFTFNKDGSLNVDHSKTDPIPEDCYLSEAVERYVLKSGTKTWYQKPETDLPIARTLLKTMGNCHRAGVDNYVTEKGKLRMLTVRECLRLMGYTDDFILPVSLAQGYKQAGNSIVVDVMMKIVDSILEHGIFEEE